ncbi:MAG TPA: LysR substrate-binding domain-containing protein [Opitutaceae bacterium]|nr:LysR substrate-binding domain-containing protein [Opitutaceae bacterium]
MPREYQFAFELRHLVYFHEVARQLHFRKAAEALAVAQPALSRQIAQLEKGLGVALFARSSRRVELTPAGKKLAAETEPLLQALRAIPADLRAVAEGEEGHLRISFTGLAMATVLPALLREFHRRHPGIRLELNESPTATQIQALQTGEIGCGFFHPEGPTPRLATRLLVEERNGILLPADHLLAKGGSAVPHDSPAGQAARTAVPRPLHLRDLAETPIVMFPRSLNPGYYDRTLAAFAQARVTPRIAEEVWPRANGIGLVQAGMGAMLMAPSEARHLPPEVVFCELRGPAPESRLVAGWNPSAVEPALQAFIEVVTQHIVSLRRGRGPVRPHARRR